MQKARNTPTSATFVPKFAKEDIVRSGHIEYQTLWASNEAEVLYRAAQAQQAAAAFSSQDILSQVDHLFIVNPIISIREVSVNITKPIGFSNL